ncbi:VQ motif [Musa troglodytarum]|uniref:VQ motif n=1 Tax=Musa troglodytarum TaxID=320322 RepID=A0A9E7FQR2_9LILI|nr:VQ motif [Musa troglodytarum]
MDSVRSRRNAELQPLVIREESHKIHEPQRKPVVIHLVSPTVIHVEAGEFTALVQRLTGRDSSAAGGSSGPAKSASFRGRKRQLPVRVKARAPKPVGKEKKTCLDQASSSQPSIPPALFLNDSSPPWSGAAELIAADHPLGYSSKF